MAVAGGFYVVLPSTTSAQAYPNNRPGSFRVDLPSPLNFGGPWKVALVGITFPAVFNAPAKPTDIVYTVNNLYFGPTELSPAPTTAQELVDRVQQLLLLSGITKAIRLKFNKLGDLTLKTDASSSLGLNFHLAHLLRLVTPAGTLLLRYYKHLSLGDFVMIKPRKTVTLWDVKAETPLPLVAALPEKTLYLYVCVDIVEPHPVGNVNANLLRVLEVPLQQGRVVSLDFVIPMYFDLARRTIRTVTVFIADGSGKEIPFERQAVQLTLHFIRSHAVQ